MNLVSLHVCSCVFIQIIISVMGNVLALVNNNTITFLYVKISSQQFCTMKMSGLMLQPIIGLNSSNLKFSGLTISLFS